MPKKKNYNKMYASEEEKVTPEEVIEPTIEDDSATEVSEVTEVVDVVEETAPKAEPKTVIGVVANCSKLNVREQMHTKAAVLCVLPASTEVKVIADEKHDEWYHVITENGVEGFCMKKYISINS